MRLPWSPRSRRVRAKPLFQAPFLGRESLLAELDRHLQDAQHGTAQYVALEGDYGSGKSALLTEFTLGHRRTSDVFTVRLHAGECLLESEFYAHLFDTLRVQSEKVLQTLYKQTNRLRKTLAVQWDEAEFCHFLTSTDWAQLQEESPPAVHPGSRRIDPLRQILEMVYQHPWAVGATTILDVITRELAMGGRHEPWTPRWVALLQALRARRLHNRAAMVLLIDPCEPDSLGHGGAEQRWRHHWQTFVEATRDNMIPLFVIWAGTTASLLPVRQAFPETGLLTVHTLGGLTEEDYRLVVRRLRRAVSRPVQEQWQRLVSAHAERFRVPGVLLLATTWMIARAETPTIEEHTLEQTDITTLVNDLVQTIRRRHPDAEGLFRQLLESCAFLPSGKEFTVEDILPLCDLDALDLDVLTGRIKLETLLGDYVRYGLLTYNSYVAQYTSSHGLIQQALQHLAYPEPTERQTIMRWRRLAAAVMYHLRRGEQDILTELAQRIEAEAGEEVRTRFAPFLVTPMRRILVSSTQEERQRIAFALGKFRSSLAVALLVTTLSDREEKVRSRAAQSLAELEGIETREALLTACRDSNSDVRWIAALALGKMEGKTTVDALIEMLTDEDKEVGRIAAQGLGTKGDTRAVPHLIAAMRDRYPLLRESAAVALGQLADCRALPALQELLQDAHSQVRRSAEEALARLSPSSR
jgi:hypothetical protein